MIADFIEIPNRKFVHGGSIRGQSKDGFTNNTDHFGYNHLRDAITYNNTNENNSENRGNNLGVNESGEFKSNKSSFSKNKGNREKIKVEKKDRNIHRIHKFKETNNILFASRKK